jgi:hypothetical protein
MPSPRSVVHKKRRAKRARARQRPRGHDLRGQYRESDLPSGHLNVLTYEDPYEPAGRVDPEGNLDVTARLEPARHADGTMAEGEPGWTPPRRPLVTVVANLREDPLGRLYARRQIGQPQFLAGREYQECHDAAVITAVRSVDLSKTKVSGGLPAEPLTERQRRAAAKVRSIEASVLRRYGDVGLWLVRLVLAERRPLEATARQAGATSARETSSVCWLFRKCLDTIAVATGFMSAVRRPYRSNGHAETNPADDPGRHATEDEIFDLKLRYSAAKRPA